MCVLGDSEDKSRSTIARRWRSAGLGGDEPSWFSAKQVTERGTSSAKQLKPSASSTTLTAVLEAMAALERRRPNNENRLAANRSGWWSTRCSVVERQRAPREWNGRTGYRGYIRPFVNIRFEPDHEGSRSGALLAQRDRVLSRSVGGDRSAGASIPREKCAHSDAV